MIDVQIGTVGYLLTLRPLDAHIRSGNPFLAGWLAALICYPPFVYGFMGAGRDDPVRIPDRRLGLLDRRATTALLWVWAGWLVFLTAVYAWATVAFGIRFSNLTYRGVLTNGPYRFTRHPAYLSKNLFWWCSALPFLVTTGSLTRGGPQHRVPRLRQRDLLLARAGPRKRTCWPRMPKYRDYHAWMARARPDHRAAAPALLAWARPRRVQVQPAE